MVEEHPHALTSFSDRLSQVVRSKGTPAMVGIDPHWDLIPDAVKTPVLQAKGKSLASVAQIFHDFCQGVLDKVASLVPIVKFQSAFFESAGPAGCQVLFDLMASARDRDLMVVLDGKRNDIGSTAAAYARAYLGGWRLEGDQFPAWSADALTVNAYLGEEGLKPFVDVSKEYGAGIFVLVRTSNPGAGKLQDRDLQGEPAGTVYQQVADWVEEASRQTLDSQQRFGLAGAVVGATVPQQLMSLRDRLAHCWLLIPGYGAQGGTSADIASAFADDGLGAVVNSSRGILYAYRQEKYADLDWQDAVTHATHDMIADLAKHTPAGQLR